jgi:hypothetical protein
LDDLLEGLQADLGVLAAFFHWGLGAGGNLGKCALLVFNLLLGGGADVLDEHARHVGVYGLEHVFDQACAVDNSESCPSALGPSLKYFELGA